MIDVYARFNRLLAISREVNTPIMSVIIETSADSHVTLEFASLGQLERAAIDIQKHVKRFVKQEVKEHKLAAQSAHRKGRLKLARKGIV